MNTTDLVQFPSAEFPERPAARCPLLGPSRYELAAPVRSSIFRSRQFLIDQQRLDGSWARTTTLDVASRAQLVLLDTFLDRQPWDCGESPGHAILRDQLPAGGWSLAAGNSIDLDASVLAYLALKLLGENANHPDMARARQAIRQRGGADACCATTRLWLALFGQIEYDNCPTISPEWLLMPACTSWFSAADELRLAAYSVAWTLRPRRDVELARGVRELFIEQPQHWPKTSGYFAADTSTPASGLWSGCERFSFLPLRKRALTRADFLLTDAAAEPSGGVVSVNELAWQRIALHALGHAGSSRVVVRCEYLRQQLDSADADDARSHSETSLTADTALALEALVSSGIGADELPVTAGIGWLATHRLDTNRRTSSASEVAALLQVGRCLTEVRSATDGSLPPRIQLAVENSPFMTDRDVPPSAVDPAQLVAEHLQACHRLQRGDGGWNFADETISSRRWRGMLRASDHSPNTASEPAATGRMLELISHPGHDMHDAAIARAVAFLGSSQRGDGSWTSPAGCRPIESTTWALRGLIAASAQQSQPAIGAGVNWLLIHEQDDGGWREPNDCGAVGDFTTTAESDVAQTAAVVLALVAAGLADHEATRRGIDFLVGTQSSGELDQTAWSLLALSRWAVAIEGQAPLDQPTDLRLVCCDSL